MKKFIGIFLFSGLLIFLSQTTTSCDKVENPVIAPTELDTNLYPGNWSDYPWPTFTANSNTDRNVLLEDFTGHKCPNCPAAASVATGIENGNPGRVFVVSVHAAPGDAFQATSTQGDGEWPYYAHDFTTEAGDAYVADIPGFLGNPAATINRIITNEGNNFTHQSSQWGTITSDLLTANDLKVNLQQEINYYPSTNGLFVHVEAETMSQLSANVSVVSYFIQKEVDSQQKDGSQTIYHYHHHNVLADVISPIYGDLIFSSAAVGEKFQVDFSYAIPENDSLNIDSNIRVITYAMNIDTYEIYHVIQSDVIP